MPSTISLIKQLKNDFSQYDFKESPLFSWSPIDNIIYFNNKDKNCQILILHELAHGLLKHTGYDRDVELVAIERSAWDKVIELCQKYPVQFDESFVQSNLDTYRDWMHNRSKCPNCEASGIQIDKDSYRCLACNHEWRVNEARSCMLRRYKI